MSPKNTISKDELFELLNSFNYYENIFDLISTKLYTVIYNEKKSKKIENKTFLEAADCYLQENLYKIEISRINKWTSTLSDPQNHTEEELLVEIIDILDWGNVWEGNVKSVLNMYRIGNLKDYIIKVNSYLENPKMIINEDFSDVKMSSGWTKIYSYTYNNFLIYDSRVSAFLNYTLERSYLKHIENLDSEQIPTIELNLNKICSLLYNFGGGNGANNRKRKVEILSNFRRSSAPENNIYGFNANVLATWIAEYIVQKYNKSHSQPISIRTIERSFFMLGFDLNQIY